MKIDPVSVQIIFCKWTTVILAIDTAACKSIDLETARFLNEGGIYSRAVTISSIPSFSAKF